MPSLARDMRHPHHFDKVINKAFAIAAGVSFVAGAAGYLMIGNTVSDEVSFVPKLQEDIRDVEVACGYG